MATTNQILEAAIRWNEHAAKLARQHGDERAAQRHHANAEAARWRQRPEKAVRDPLN